MIALAREGRGKEADDIHDASGIDKAIGCSSGARRVPQRCGGTGEGRGSDLGRACAAPGPGVAVAGDPGRSCHRPDPRQRRDIGVRVVQAVPGLDHGQLRDVAGARARRDGRERARPSKS